MNSRMSVYLADEHYKELKALSVATGESMNSLVVEAVKQYLIALPDGEKEKLISIKEAMK